MKTLLIAITLILNSALVYGQQEANLNTQLLDQVEAQELQVVRQQEEARGLSERIELMQRDLDHAENDRNIAAGVAGPVFLISGALFVGTLKWFFKKEGYITVAARRFFASIFMVLEGTALAGTGYWIYVSQSELNSIRDNLNQMEEALRGLHVRLQNDLADVCRMRARLNSESQFCVN